MNTPCNLEKCFGFASRICCFYVESVREGAKERVVREDWAGERKELLNYCDVQPFIIIECPRKYTRIVVEVGFFLVIRSSPHPSVAVQRPNYEMEFF